MLDLPGLLGSPGGRDLLRRKRIYTLQGEFVDQLAPPVNPALRTYLDTGDKNIVWSGHQTYVDCTQSIVRRVQALEALKEKQGVFSFFLWLDTDRTGSDPRIERFAWPLFGKEQFLRIVPRNGNYKYMEPRFIQFDPAWAQAAIGKLESYLPQTKGYYRAQKKYQRFKEVFLRGDVETLSDFNMGLSQFLLEGYNALRPHSVVASRVLNDGVLNQSINRLLYQLGDVIRVFNQHVDSLIETGIDPVVQHLPEDYLPLNYSCPIDGARLRLRHLVSKADHYAAADCHCGETYRFFLGTNQLNIGQIAETDRWSTDFFTTALFNDLVSGYVAGYSSSVYYGLIMGEVLETVLNSERIPILVPESLHDGALKSNSLIYSYLFS